MLYILLIVLNIGYTNSIQESTFIGKWQVLEIKDSDDPNDLETPTNVFMNIYNDGRLEVIDEGDSEIREWRLIDGIFYIVDEDKLGKVEMKIENDKMTWNYDEEIIVFSRIK